MVKFDKFQSSLVKLSGSSSVDALINEIVSYIRESIKILVPIKLIHHSSDLFVMLLRIPIQRKVFQIIKLIKRKLY